MKRNFAIIVIVCLSLFFGCSSPKETDNFSQINNRFEGSDSADLTTDTWSASFLSHDDKIAFLGKYLVMPSDILDAEYHITYYDNSGGLIPGPSDWEVKAAIKAAPENIALWIGGFEKLDAEFIDMDWWSDLETEKLSWSKLTDAEFFKRPNAQTYIVIYEKEGIILKMVSSMYMTTAAIPAAHTETPALTAAMAGDKPSVGFDLAIDSSSEKQAEKISVRYNDGDTVILSQHCSSIPVMNNEQSHLAYLSNFIFEEQAELNIFDIRAKENHSIELNLPDDGNTAKSIMWYNNDILLISVGNINGAMSFGDSLYALYLSDNSIKKIADCVDVQIYDLTNGLNMIYFGDNDNTFTYEIYIYPLYSIIDDKANQTVLKIRFRPTPNDMQSADYVHFDGLYERAAKPYFLYAHSDNGILSLSPYAIGDFLSLDSDEIIAILSYDGEFFGFATDWYPCGLWCAMGEVRRFASASSVLRRQGENTFEAENALENNVGSCWSEGVSGYGIGESISITQSLDGSGAYSYAKYSADEVDERGFPVIDGDFHDGDDCIFFYTSFCIVNGYARSESLWRENSRVKTINLYINDELYAKVHLDDTIKPQYLPIYNYPSRAGKNTVFRFEITDVYPGEKYADTCITGINFGFRGIGGHNLQD